MAQDHEIQNNYGTIFINKEVLGTLVGVAATECYGVVGMVSHRFRDGWNQLLGRDVISRGVEINTDAEALDITLHIIAGYGTKMSEIANNVIQAVKYNLAKDTNIVPRDVTVIVEDVRMVD